MMCPRVPNVSSEDPVISMEGKLHGLAGPQESYYTIHCNFPYIEDILAVQRARLSQYTVWAGRTVLHATMSLSALESKGGSFGLDIP